MQQAGSGFHIGANQAAIHQPYCLTPHRKTSYATSFQGICRKCSRWHSCLCQSFEPISTKVNRGMPSVADVVTVGYKAEAEMVRSFYRPALSVVCQPDTGSVGKRHFQSISNQIWSVSIGAMLRRRL